MDVVIADVARAESQEGRQLQKGASAQCGVGVVPVAGVLPVGVLELMLDIEEPDADRTREQRGRSKHEQVVEPAYEPA